MLGAPTFANACTREGRRRKATLAFFYLLAARCSEAARPNLPILQVSVLLIASDLGRSLLNIRTPISAGILPHSFTFELRNILLMPEPCRNAVGDIKRPYKCCFHPSNYFRYCV